MRTRTRFGLAMVVCLGAWLVPAAALACGAYVAKTDTIAFNDAVELAIVRSGTTTYVTVRNEYRGPAEEFAILVPVPALLGPDDVVTLDRSVFDTLDQVAGPRLTYESERDPCVAARGDGPASGSGGGGGSGVGTGSGSGSSPPPLKVEAAFAAGEYDIVVLSAKESAALDRWLIGHGYRMPAGLPPLLAPYIAGGWKFFVAKVDPKRVTFDAANRAVLSTIRFVYDAPDLTIPVRLATLNSAGEQDLVLYTIADTPMEVANRPDVDAPRGAVLNARGRDDFGGFYRAVFARTIAKEPDAAVNEYVGSIPWYQREIVSALGGAADGEHVVTRFHLRVRKTGNVDDLVLRAAKHAFHHAEFFYRTPWTGPVTCADAKRGVWDADLVAGAGAGTGSGAGVGAYVDVAKGDVPAIEDMITEPFAALGVVPTSKPPIPASAPGPAARTGHDRGCGCGATSAGGGAGIAVIVMALCNRRRRRDLYRYVDR